MGRWTDGELLDEVSTAAYGAHLVRPDTRIVQRDGWYQVITPSAQSHTLNEVVYSRVEPERVEAVIDEVSASYAALRVPFKWCVWPHTRPGDTGRRLEQRGFERWLARGMVCDPASVDLGPPAAGVEVHRIGVDELDIYVRVVAEGWELDGDQLGADLRAAFARGETHRRCYLATRDSEPAGVAATVVHARSAYLMGAVVLPAHRGAGVYKQLIRARLDDLTAAGIDLATTLAREQTSAPMLEHMGFRTVCPLDCYARV